LNLWLIKNIDKNQEAGMRAGVTLQRAEKLFLGGAVVFVLLRISLITLLPLTGDEAYHWEWSRHLALGYYDHPPLVAWLIALFTAIGGSNLLWTRLTALLCSTGATFFTYKLGREIGGPVVGVTAGLFSLFSPAFTLGAVVVTTDSPLLFFWQLTAYLVWLAVSRNDGRWWYAAGAALGFGMLSKFLILPLIAGIGLFLLLSKTDRNWLRRKEPYLGMGIALLLFLPFIFWNSQHGWTSFVFHLTRHENNPDLLRPLVFLAQEAFLIVSPLLFAGLLWSLWRLFKLVLIKKRDEAAVSDARIAWFLLCTGWFLPLLIGVESARNLFSAHWPVAAYGVCFTGLAWLLLRRRPQATISGRWFWASAAVYTLTLSLLLLFLALEIINPVLLLGKKVRDRDLAEIYGWPAIGAAVSRAHRELGADMPLATSNYTISSMISFYTPDKLYLGVLGPGSKHGRAYDLWDDWNRYQGKNLLFILDADPAKPGSQDATILKESFRRFEVARIIPIRRHGKIIRRLYFVIGYDLKPDPYTAIRAQYRW
jgi:hypothetical protein